MVDSLFATYYRRTGAKPHALISYDPGRSSLAGFAQKRRKWVRQLFMSSGNGAVHDTLLPVVG